MQTEPTRRGSGRWERLGKGRRHGDMSSTAASAPTGGNEDGGGGRHWPAAGTAGHRGGSTHEGEEVILMDVFRSLRRERPDIALILVPRIPRGR
jgi:hypothetical protein